MIPFYYHIDELTSKLQQPVIFSSTKSQLRPIFDINETRVLEFEYWVPILLSELHKLYDLLHYSKIIQHTSSNK